MDFCYHKIAINGRKLYLTKSLSKTRKKNRKRDHEIFENSWATLSSDELNKYLITLYIVPINQF